VLDDVSLAVDDGELMGVIGASGSGKTTLLRAIAGLTRLTSGTVRIGGVDVTKVEPSSRDVSMMFQKPALLPHRDVLGNVAFPLEVHHELAAEIASRVTAETRALHIESLLARNPGQLSSGERQLVQMARAMVRTPSVMLLDEPLARLDAAMTQQLRLDLHALQQGYGVTTLLATSDPVEAMTMPDRIVVLEGGRIAQVDTPINVYERPVTLVAAACTGDMSMLDVRIEDDLLTLGHAIREAREHERDFRQRGLPGFRHRRSLLAGIIGRASSALRANVRKTQNERARSGRNRRGRGGNSAAQWTSVNFCERRTAPVSRRRK